MNNSGLTAMCNRIISPLLSVIVIFLLVTLGIWLTIYIGGERAEAIKYAAETFFFAISRSPNTCSM